VRSGAFHSPAIVRSYTREVKCLQEEAEHIEDFVADFNVA
jgi:hypothetical protein